jgi:hypothetical protein
MAISVDAFTNLQPISKQQVVLAERIAGNFVDFRHETWI